MKKNLLWFFGLALVASFAFSNCTDACKDVNCGGDDKGSCLDGGCVCNQGFEGTNCEIEWATKFAGVWAVSDSVKNDKTYTYQATVTRISETKISIENFGGFTGPNFVNLNLATSTTFVEETYTDALNRVFTILPGSLIASDKITIVYKATDGTQTDEGVAVYTK
jgi:hypothetical protein